MYSEIINQPRSKLKLPINELIKPRSEEITLNSDSVGSNGLQLNSNADIMLNHLRSNSSNMIPRLENINEIAKELAIEGKWEKAESLILNMKQDCKRLQD